MTNAGRDDELTPFERAVVERILAGMYDVPGRDVLRAQLPAMRVARREYTGVGLFVDFQHAEGVVRLPNAARGTFGGDVYAEIPGLPHGAGFVLYVIEGLVETLECFGYASDVNSWPREIRKWEMADPPREM
ncbi:MAG: hypothetical protein J0L92_22070 [Deltaproteobacteria bacterium]|nr:hypothetical protein [Deltaproteobacteria bacterium]